MDKQRAISHFLYYLQHHPAVAGINPAKVLLGHTADYEALTGAIANRPVTAHGSASARCVWTSNPPNY